MVQLVPAGPDRREEVRTLLAEYLFEFDGRTEPYPYFDAYWSDADRLPFLLEEAEEVVGLCMLRLLAGRWRIAEFYVVPAARRGGTGRDAVEAIAALARDAGASYLEAKVHPDNGRALLFWTAVGFREVAANGVTMTRREL